MQLIDLILEHLESTFEGARQKSKSFYWNFHNTD